jgi:uncharacterized delta-60 repeat protein
MRRQWISLAWIIIVALINKAAYGAPGDLDPSFIGGVTNYPKIDVVVIQPDGKIVIGGDFTLADGWSKYRIARLNSDGSLDTDFDAGYVDKYVDCIQLNSDGSMLIGGGFQQVGGATTYHIAMLNSNGTVNTAFNPGNAVKNDVYSIAAQSDGKVIIGGFFSSIGNTNISGIARLNANGSLDTNFNVGSGTYGVVYSVALQQDGRALIGGNFSSVNGVEQHFIARLNTNGTLDASFNPGIPLGGASDRVTTMLLQPDGHIVVGGLFSVTVNSTNLNSIIRLNTDGSIDTSFDPNPGSDTTISAITSEADGHLVISGNFAMIGNVVQPTIARLNPDGSLDQSFKSMTASWGTIGETPFSLASQADNKVVIGGAFDTVNQTSHNGVARLFGDYPPKFTFVGLGADGNLMLSGLAATNAHLQIYSSTNLVNWSPMGIFTNNEGTFTFEDTQWSDYFQRFYRVLWLP